jgi:hypothetical protein
VLPCSLIPSFRHSVIPSSSVSVHYLSNSCTHSTKIWHIDISNSNSVMVRWFLAELCPFYFKNNMKFSVSAHYLTNGITHSTQTWHIGYVMRKYKPSLNLVMVWWFLAELCPFHFENNYIIFSFRSLSPKRYYTFNSNLTYGYVKGMRRSSLNLVMVQWFLAELCPFTLKIIWNFQFLFIISPTVLQIQLKFDIWIRQRNVQVKIEFGHGSMIADRVIPLELWKKIRNFKCLFIISPMVAHIQLKFDI